MLICNFDDKFKKLRKNTGFVCKIFFLDRKVKMMRRCKLSPAQPVHITYEHTDSINITKKILTAFKHCRYFLRFKWRYSRIYLIKIIKIEHLTNEKLAVQGSRPTLLLDQELA